MIGINSSRVKRNYAFKTVCFALPSLSEAVCEQGAAEECELLCLTQPQRDRDSLVQLPAHAPAYKSA